MSKELIERLSDRWRSDPEFRAQVEADPKAALAASGLPVPAEEAVVAVDTEDTMHLVFPPNPNANLSDDELSGTAGGSSAGIWYNGYYYTYEQQLAGGRYSSTR